MQINSREPFAVEQFWYEQTLTARNLSISSVALNILDSADGYDRDTVDNRHALVVEYVRSLYEENEYVLTTEEMSLILSGISTELVSVDQACKKI